MYAGEIDHICSKTFSLDIATQSICTADKVPASPQFYPAYYFVNICTSWESHLGGHWILIMHHGKYNIEYFDPLALPLSHYPECLINIIYTYTHNNLRVQNMQSFMCGQFCLYVALKRLSGISLWDIQNQLLFYGSAKDDYIITYLCKMENLTV